MVFRGRKDLRKHNAELHCGKCRIQCFWNLTYPRFENSGKSSAIFDPYVFVCLKSASCESSSFYCVQYYTVWWVLAYKTLWSGQQPRWKKQHRCSHQRDQHMLCIGAGFGAGLCWGGGFSTWTVNRSYLDNVQRVIVKEKCYFYLFIITTAFFHSVQNKLGYYSLCCHSCFSYLPVKSSSETLGMLSNESPLW